MSTAGQFEIQPGGPKIMPNGDIHVNAGLILGRMIHEVLTDLVERLDRIEARLDGKEGQ